MKLKIEPSGIWYHGSNLVFDLLRPGSTITQWRELAEAFSHKPTTLAYDANGVISHNGTEKGFLFVVDEPVTVGIDIVPHPRSSMAPNVEFLTSRPLKLRLIWEL